MSLLVLLPLIPLGLYLVPVSLLRHHADARVQDDVVASGHTPPGVIQNASIGYALKMATFGPFFAWGASGDLWPVIIATLSFGLGLCLVYILRRPLLAFLDGALGRDQSITVHEFLARQHGNDPRVRLLAAGLTIFALAGLILAESIALAGLLKPILPAAAAQMLVVGTLVLTLLFTTLSGNSGAMRAGQTQLGLIDLGLFGAAAFLLYLQTSTLAPMPPQGTLAVVFVALFCLALVAYRRSRYVDTSPVISTGKGAGRFRRFEKVLNVFISFFAVLAVVLAVMQLSAEGTDAAVRDSLTALQAGARVPLIGLFALALLPFFYPMADITNWQRIAAFEKSDIAPEHRASAFRRLFRIYAIESPLMWLFMCVFGAIAAVATATPGDAPDVFQEVLRQLAAQPNLIVTIALSLLLIAVFAMALSMMGSAYSAVLCTLRYDVLPAIASNLTTVPDDTAARRRTLIAAALICLIIIVAFCLAQATFKISFDSPLFLALIFSVCCAQLAFVPLLLRPLMDARSAGSGSVGASWALAILAGGCAAALGAVATYLATGQAPWLWAAAPACLGAGFLLAAIARMKSTA